ncbi:MAG: glycosyltransferase family 4 protein [Cyanobacteria bacterium P01_H01_bin.74]
MVHNFLGPYGGAETVVYKQYDLLKSQGYSVFLFGSNYKPRFFEDLPHEDLFPSHTNYDNLQGVAQKFNALLKPFGNKEAENNFRAFLKEVNPDLVHFHSVFWHLSASVIQPCVEMKIPIVMTLHETRLICPSGTLMRSGQTYCKDLLCATQGAWHAIKHRCYEKSLAKSILVAAEFKYRTVHKLFDQVNQFICPSKALRDLLVHSGVHDSRVSVIPNFIDDSWMDLPKPEKKGNYFLFAGRISREKGLHSLMQALYELDGTVPVKIAGDGPEAANIKKTAKQLNLKNIEFLGFVKSSAMYSLYQNAIANILPCNWFESFGLSIIESYAAGRPCIASSIGGIADLIDHEKTGYLIPTDNIKALKNAITACVDQPNHTFEMGKLGQTFIKNNFNKFIFLEKYQSLVRSLT